MKTRSGFVSNSSSSSFIIENPGVGISTLYVARNMLELIQKESKQDRSRPGNLVNNTVWINFYINWDKQIEEMILRLGSLEQAAYNSNPPLKTNKSLNGVTYIWKSPNGICIKTSNNHHWEGLGTLLHWRAEANFDNSNLVDTAWTQLQTIYGYREAIEESFFTLETENIWERIERFCKERCLPGDRENERVSQLIELLLERKKKGGKFL